MLYKYILVISIHLFQYHFLNPEESNDGIFKINVTEYPVLRKDESVVNVYHGVNISDPYRYLEDLDNEETINFISKLNAITDRILNHTKYKDFLVEKIVNYFDYEYYDIYDQYGDYYYYKCSYSGSNVQSLYQKKNLSDEGKKILDIENLSKNGLISCDFIRISSDGKLIAYGLYDENTNSSTTYFINDKGEKIPDVLKDVKEVSSQFIFNNTGYLYSVYSNKVDSEDESYCLYYHKLGTSQEEDIGIFECPKYETFVTFGYASNDENYLFVDFFDDVSGNNSIFYYNVSELPNKNEITKKLDWKLLFDSMNGSYFLFDSNEEDVFVHTNSSFLNGMIFKMKISDAGKGENSWTILVSEDKNKCLLDVQSIGKKYFMTRYLENFKTTFYIHNKETGKVLQQINIDVGNVKVVSSNFESNEFFMLLSNQKSPGTIYRGNIDEFEKGQKIKLEIIEQPMPKGLNFSDFVVDQIFYPSKDGIMVPMVMFHKKDLKLDGNNPVMLEKYDPLKSQNYNPLQLFFVENFNFIWCTAIIRGSDEYGEKWHQEGILHKKQNAFDDFIAGTEYLIENNYTRSSKIAIWTSFGSGLLISVVTQQRPELFGAVIMIPSITDMLRVYKLEGKDVWKRVYGDPDKKEDFDYIIKYSPLHNLKIPPKLIQWPNTLIISLYKSKIIVGHTLKYIATLYETLQQAKDYQTNPVIAFIEKSDDDNETPFQVIDMLSKMIDFLKLSLNLTWED